MYLKEFSAQFYTDCSIFVYKNTKRMRKTNLSTKTIMIKMSDDKINGKTNGILIINKKSF
jgi:hypothetical protein